MNRRHATKLLMIFSYHVSDTATKHQSLSLISGTQVRYGGPGKDESVTLALAKLVMLVLYSTTCFTFYYICLTVKTKAIMYNINIINVFYRVIIIST